MKKVILFLLSLVHLYLASCQSSKINVKQDIDNPRKTEKEKLIISDGFLSNQNRNIIYASKSEYFKKINQKPIGVFRGYGEAVGTRNNTNARLLADQRALLDIARQIRVTVRSTTLLQKYDTHSSFRQEITTSTLSTLKNAQPTRWYDESHNTFYTIMEINRNLVYDEIKRLDRRVNEDARYYFKKALSEQKYNKFSLALKHYLYAYYISAQSQNSVIEYYDRSTRRTFNVLIESKSRIQNILEKLDFNITSSRQRVITFRAIFKGPRQIPSQAIPLNITLYQNTTKESFKITTDYEGKAVLSLQENFDPSLPVNFEAGIHFSRLVESVSTEFYGFPDRLFHLDITNIQKRFQLYIEPVFIDVFYYFIGDFFYDLPPLSDIQKENIHFIFSNVHSYKNQIKRILRSGHLDAPFLANHSLVIMGQITADKKKWGQNYLINGHFNGIYADMKKKKVLKNISFDFKAYGVTKDAAITDFYRRLKGNLFKVLLDQE